MGNFNIASNMVKAVFSLAAIFGSYLGSKVAFFGN